MGFEASRVVGRFLVREIPGGLRTKYPPRTSRLRRPETEEIHRTGRIFRAHCTAEKRRPNYCHEVRLACLQPFVSRAQHPCDHISYFIIFSIIPGPAADRPNAGAGGDARRAVCRPHDGCGNGTPFENGRAGGRWHGGEWTAGKRVRPEAGRQEPTPRVDFHSGSGRAEPQRWPLPTFAGSRHGQPSGFRPGWSENRIRKGSPARRNAG